MGILKFEEFINEGMISDYKSERTGIKLTDEQVEFINSLKKSFNSINMLYGFKNQDDKFYYPEYMDKQGSWDMEKITDKCKLILPKPTSKRLSQIDKKYKSHEIQIMNDVFKWFEDNTEYTSQGDDDSKSLFIELKDLLKKSKQIENKIF